MQLLHLFALAAAFAVDAIPTEGQEKTQPLDKRGFTSINCGGGWGKILDPGTVERAIAKIDAGHSYCHGTQGCKQVACASGGSGFARIGFCKQNKCLTGRTIIDRTRQIERHCFNHNNGNYAGQAFYQDGTNVILQNSACA